MFPRLLIWIPQRYASIDLLNTALLNLANNFYHFFPGWRRTFHLGEHFQQQRTISTAATSQNGWYFGKREYCYADEHGIGYHKLAPNINSPKNMNNSYRRLEEMNKSSRICTSSSRLTRPTDSMRRNGRFWRKRWVYGLEMINSRLALINVLFLRKLAKNP